MRVVLVGGGGYASNILGVFEEIWRLDSASALSVAGIVADGDVDDRRFRHRGIKQIGSIEEISSIDASHYIVAIGWPKNRQAVYERVRDCGMRPATVIHPKANIPPDVPVGEGTVIFAGACVAPMAVIGSHVGLSAGALVGHDCVVADFVSIMLGATVCGDTMLGQAALIGANATVLEKRRIGDGAVVGAGSVVVKDIPAGVTAVGVPATWK